MAILFIEDERTLAQYVVGEFEKNRQNVERVGRSDSGYEVAHCDPLDLLAVYRMLPELDGFTLVTRMQFGGFSRSCSGWQSS
jgi:DNA-binding response OmpR family regulator